MSAHEPVHIGRLLGETLRFIFTRPHLWLMAWAPGFVILFIVSFWLFGESSSTFRNAKVVGLDAGLLLWMFTMAMIIPFVTPQIYSGYLKWRTSVSLKTNRALTSTILRSIVPSIFLHITIMAFITFMDELGMFRNGEEIQVWALISMSIPTLLIYGIFSHILIVTSDRNHIWTIRNELNALRGKILNTISHSILIATISLLLAFAILFFIILVKIINIWIDNNTIYSDFPFFRHFLITLCITASCVAFTLPFQVFHSAVHTRLIEINEGTALGTNVDQVFE